MLIVSDSVRISTCWPPQAGQRVSAAGPFRRTTAHGFENTMWPRADFTTPMP